jgi:uncharacterized membrane protein
MLRKLVLFVTALFLALTAGRAVWVWLGENPFNMSGQTYVEFFQQLDQRIVVPIAITGIGGTVLAGLAAWMFRQQRAVSYLLLAACVLGVIGSLVTMLFNIPVNQRLATWNPKALPPDYQVYLLAWWRWHHVRLVSMFVAMCLVFLAMLSLQEPQSVFVQKR